MKHGQSRRAPRLIPRGRPRRRTIAALAFAGPVVAAMVIVLTVQSPSSASDASAQTQASGAAAVERRDLVETDTESGTLSYASPQTVYDRLSGTVTWLPSVGQVIKPGGTLFKVDGRPVTLMSGSTPAYRDLDSSDSTGQDILELNRNLVALGFDPDGIVVDDQWQPATTAGVDVLQASLGETETGSLSLGEVVFLPGDQLVSGVEATLGGTGGSSANPSGSGASDTGPRARPEFVDYTTATPSPGGAPKPRRPASGHTHGSGDSTLGALRALVALLRAEVAELRAGRSAGGHPGASSAGKGGGGSPAAGGAGNSSSSGKGAGSSSGSSGSSSSGGGGVGASPVLQTTSTQLVVTVDLDASKQSEAKVGEKVTVQMPNSDIVNGRVSAVSPVAQSSSGNSNGSGNGGGSGGSGSGNGNGNGGGSSGATIPVTVTLSGHQTGAGLDQAAVSVNFVQAVANDVLSVPVTALLATAGGSYAVQEAAAPHKVIPVTTGLFAAGYVQISGSAIYPGLQVTDSQG